MVLLPLPPFIVAIVIICLMADLPLRLICVRQITWAQCYRILGRQMTGFHGNICSF